MSPQLERITSLQNAKVKLANKLRTRRWRDREMRFVIDDLRDLQRAVALGYTIDFVFVESQFGDIDLPAAAQVYIVSSDVLAKVSYRDNPSSIVAVMHRKSDKTGDQLGEMTAAAVLGLVDLRKPGNIGALLRTADAAGFGAVFLIDTSLDIYNPNVIRSSTGACFLDNIFQVTSGEALRFFRANNYTVVAARPDGGKDLFAIQVTRPAAVILGTEDQGLSPFWLEHSDQTISIPMSGQVSDSLNVSVSGAIIMYEIYRQQHVDQKMS